MSHLGSSAFKKEEKIGLVNRECQEFRVRRPAEVRGREPQKGVTATMARLRARHSTKVISLGQHYSDLEGSQELWDPS